MVITLYKKLLIIICFIFLSGCGANTLYEGINEQNTAPTYSPQKTQYDEKVGVFETTLVDKEKNRINNVKLACDSINRTRLEPGQEFSFNETVGERTRERGYKEASILIDGKKERGIGGGICQVSTTVYNAAIDADLEILERHEHSKKVPYIEKGKDATISGKLDLKIRNPHDFPVKFEVATNGEMVTVVVYKDL